MLSPTFSVGTSRDLVRHGENGFIFPSGNTGVLTGCIQKPIDQPEEQRRLMGMKSREWIEMWVKRDLAQSLGQYFDFVYS